MSRRTGASPRGRLLGIDPDQLAAAVVVGGAVLAVAAVVLGGFLPAGDALVSLLYPLAVLFPVLGAVLVCGASWLFLSSLDRTGASELLEGTPPEDAVTATEHRVGREINWEFDSAGSERYQCRTNDAATDVRRRLVDGAVRVLTTAHGLEREAAAEAVRAGTWTDDPVAAAFLATDGRQPPDERWRGAIDPGLAYDRRVRRTLEAIEALEAGESAGTLETAEHPPGTEVSR